MNKKCVVVVLGKSASGKTTVARYLSSNYKYDFVVPFTTRPKRNNEQHEVDYVFVSENTFNQIDSLNKFYAKSSFRGWNYGICETDLETVDHPIIVGDNKMLPQIVSNKQYHPILLYIVRDDTVRVKEQKERGCDPKEIIRRFDDEQIVWKEITENPLYKLYYINNDSNLENSITQCLEAIADGVYQGE